MVRVIPSAKWGWSDAVARVDALTINSTVCALTSLRLAAARSSAGALRAAKPFPGLERISRSASSSHQARSGACAID